jgi:hypothetical protein
MDNRERPIKLTVVMDRSLEQAIAAERQRLASETGLPVSMSAAAVRCIRTGLAAERQR